MRKKVKINIDEEIHQAQILYSFTPDYNFGENVTVSPCKEGIRGETSNTFINGVPVDGPETTPSPKERLRRVFHDELSGKPLKSRIIHSIYRSDCSYGDFVKDPEQLCRKFLLATTAVIPTTHVDVHSTMSSQTSKSIEDMLEESFTLGSSRSTSGSISQSVCRKIRGCTYTSTSPGERGFQVVKLDVFDFIKICKKPCSCGSELSTGNAIATCSIEPDKQDILRHQHIIF
ncbi:PREDICTED: uncharacterized protein LOC108965307 [Bactrocera latifrons]|uniref:uncharacterized protein LOC108965307 n=1 Tax=Bactrocera latifrons TaxID=174628 RepID=UPI0008DE6F6A|nr:PREDICTED: uncharacterized protein LOC108965307 [Bactrocera latifrons]XP_018783170.1 PREDICTED: uncharacterized protein LOC108965307 [Bactrocera latifrons]XP_018783171.1 PREDICTED: uncharacterized protein LOC108965307 [Bactrocera latifrons]XP_018783172.1 PREDICTED: uncharacterized protein LOC108965307 [Bactrocera latifrons]XP_018783173.1 PREDICTED: uncharacterized protein LOC108965307 [Bactrocera latifrons]